MRDINFLSWRLRRQAMLQRRYSVMVVSAVMTALLLLAYQAWGLKQDRGYWRGEQERLRAALTHSEQALTQAEARQQSLSEMVDWLANVGALRQQGRDNAWLLNMLASQLPEGLMLSLIERQGQKVLIEGQVLSEALLTHFLRQITTEGPLGFPVLEQLGGDARPQESTVFDGKPFRVTLRFTEGPIPSDRGQE